MINYCVEMEVSSIKNKLYDEFKELSYQNYTDPNPKITNNHNHNL